MANLPIKGPAGNLDNHLVDERPRDAHGHFIPRGGKRARGRKVSQVIDGQRYYSPEELRKRSRLFTCSRTPLLHDLGVLGLTLQPNAHQSDPRIDANIKADPDPRSHGRRLLITRPDDFKLGVMFPIEASYDPEQFREARAAGKRERQTRFLELIRTGTRKYAAAKEVGISPNTYRWWVKYDENFAGDLEDAVDAAVHARSFGLDPSDDKYVPDFEDFRLYFFGMESADHHLQIIDALENAGPDDWTLILMPPDSGKTTVVKDWICWKWAEDPDHRVMYVGEKDDSNSTPTKVMMDIKERLTDPEYRDAQAKYPVRIDEYISTYGPFRVPSEDTNRPWKQSAIKIHKAGGGAFYSLETASYLSRVLGARVDAIIFDDVQSEQTLNQTDKILDKIQGVFASRYDRVKGKVLFIGNAVGAGSVYEKMIKEGMINTVIIIPAIGEDGQSFWPDRWPIDSLQRRRQLVGESRWLANYQQQPRSPGSVVFAPEIFDLAKDQEMTVTNSSTIWRASRHSDALEIVAGIDPAISGECSITVAAFTNDKMTILDQDILANPGTTEAIFERIRYMTKHRFNRLVFEYNAQQKGIGRDARLEKIAEKAGFVIEPHETGANKRDVNYGVSAMASSFIRREIIIPWGDERTRARMKPLEDQLVAWRPEIPTKLLKQDAVMSMWFTWLWWERHRQFMSEGDESWDFDVPELFSNDLAAASAFNF